MDLDLQLNLICRVCLQDGDMRSIYEMDDFEMPLNDKIMQTTGLVIERHINSELPDQICSKCINDLDVAYRFRMNCESSDAILQTYIHQKDSKSNIKILFKEESVNDEDDEDINYFDENEIIYEDHLSQSHSHEQEISGDEILVERDMTVVEEKKPVIKRNVVSVAPKVKDESKSTAFRDRSEKKKHVCDMCGGAFKNKTELTAHVRRHLGERPFECDSCDKKFTVMSGLRVHMRTHTGDKPYACKHCGRAFSDFGSRNKHERTHTGERPYVCSTCGVAFALSHALKRHGLSHSGEKNHVCNTCNKAFATTHNLKQHQNVHLRERGLPYKKYIRKSRRPPGASGTVLVHNQDDSEEPHDEEEEEDDNIVHVIRFDQNNATEHHQTQNGEEEELLAVSLLTNEVVENEYITEDT